MPEVESIFRDTRPIYSVWSVQGGYIGAVVGDEGVTKIEPYWEAIDKSMWFIVWCGDELRKRLRADAMAAVRYIIPSGQ